MADTTAHRTNEGSAPTGAMSELLATTYLLRHGFEVYKAWTHTAPVDLIAYGHGQLLRVQVKTLTEAGRTVAFRWPKDDHWDVLLVVARDGDVHWFDRRTTTYGEAIDEVRVFYGIGPRVIR